jgi:hypothetical protein
MTRKDHKDIHLAGLSKSRIDVVLVMRVYMHGLGLLTHVSNMCMCRHHNLYWLILMVPDLNDDN